MFSGRFYEVNMSFFNKDFISFFEDLEKNNDRDWFKANKKRYEESVRFPFEMFIGKLVSMIQDDDPEVRMEPKEGIFRIYRDVRFSKDKRPYKTTASALISPFGRKRMDFPGIYIELSTNGIQFYGGAYFLEKDALERLRRTIIKENNKFNSLIQDKSFKNNFGDILGEKNKRLPAEFQKDAEKIPYLYNKQFFYGKKLPEKEILNPGLDQIIFDLYLAGKPFNSFLKSAIY